MTRKQTGLIALMCAIAAILAAFILWRAPSSPAGEEAEHAGHADSHGHDDRHGEADAEPAAEEQGIAMSEAQIKANGIAIDSAGPALIQERLHLPAQVQADAERTVALAAPAAGMVQSVLVSLGTPVKKGQPLLVIASPAAAGWRAEHGSARQRLALARTTFEREQSLWEGGISARQDFDAARTALKEAEIAFEAAGQRLRALGIETGGAAVGPISANVTVRAPLDGVVVARQVVAGQAADEIRPLLTIADLSRVWIEAAVPAASLSQVATGMPARVSINAAPNAREGTVSFVGPVLGETTRMAQARVTLSNPGLRLRPGMLATVDLLGQGAQVPVSVASDAVQTIHERSVVFVRSAAGFRPQQVTTGRSDGRRTEIVTGLAAGSRYAAAGSFLLKADLGKRDAEHDH